MAVVSSSDSTLVWASRRTPSGDSSRCALAHLIGNCGLRTVRERRSPVRREIEAAAPPQSRSGLALENRPVPTRQPPASASQRAETFLESRGPTNLRIRSDRLGETRFIRQLPAIASLSREQESDRPAVQPVILAMQSPNLSATLRRSPSDGWFDCMPWSCFRASATVSAPLAFSLSDSSAGPPASAACDRQAKATTARARFTRLSACEAEYAVRMSA